MSNILKTLSSYANLLPLEKTRVSECFSDRELHLFERAVWHVSYAIPEKNEVSEEKEFSRGVVSFRSFLWTRKEKNIIQF